MKLVAALVVKSKSSIRKFCKKKIILPGEAATMETFLTLTLLLAIFNFLRFFVYFFRTLKSVFHFSLNSLDLACFEVDGKNLVQFGFLGFFTNGKPEKKFKYYIISSSLKYIDMNQFVILVSVKNLYMSSIPNKSRQLYNIWSHGNKHQRQWMIAQMVERLLCCLVQIPAPAPYEITL